MKRLRRVLAYIGVGIASLIAVAIGVLYAFFPRAHAATQLTVSKTPEEIERGRYLVEHVYICVQCHSEVDPGAPGEPIVRKGTGREIGRYRSLGTFRSANITPEQETGIGSWSDGEILRAVREGVRKDGSAIAPMMPFMVYRETMSDADGAAIISYLRTLPPIAKAVPRTDITPHLRPILRLFPAPVEKPVAAPPADDSLERGQWLLRVASCRNCHTPQDEGGNFIETLSFAGGEPGETPKGKVYSANITPDPATGIGAYSDDDIIRALREGVRKDGKALYLMPWKQYRGLTDADMRALVKALRALPPVKHVVPAREFKD